MIAKNKLVNEIDSLPLSDFIGLLLLDAMAKNGKGYVKD